MSNRETSQARSPWKKVNIKTQTYYIVGGLPVKIHIHVMEEVPTIGRGHLTGLPCGGRVSEGQVSLCLPLGVKYRLFF